MKILLNTNQTPNMPFFVICPNILLNLNDNYKSNHNLNYNQSRYQHEFRRAPCRYERVCIVHT